MLSSSVPSVSYLLAKYVALLALTNSQIKIKLKPQHVEHHKTKYIGLERCKVCGVSELLKGVAVVGVFFDSGNVV